MTPAEFKQARQSLGLTQAQLAEILNITPQTIRKYEADPVRKTARAPNPIACRALSWMLAGFHPPQWPDLPREVKTHRVRKRKLTKISL